MVGGDFPPSKRHGNTLYHVFPHGCMPMLCQMEESGDSIGCTSLFFKNMKAGSCTRCCRLDTELWKSSPRTKGHTCLCASTSWQCTAREREYALKKQGNREKSEGAEAAQHEKWQ